MEFRRAKRDNNPKREFIIINSEQGKHVPSRATNTEEMFSRLGKKLKEVIKSESGEGCLVIGFAETAVGVGAYVAREIGEKCLYLSTTREELAGYFPVIRFEESHSHAAEHALCCLRSREFLKIKTVIAADDEFTTGETAIKLVKALKRYLPSDCRTIAAGFVASKESRESFKNNDIECFAEYDFDAISNKNFPEKFIPDRKISPKKPDLEIMENAVLDQRLGVYSGEFFGENEKSAENILKKIGKISGSVRVFGTEENCVLPIILGAKLEKIGVSATVQGVTRSPMLPADDENYPIKNRAELQSLYDENRTVYLYNCEKCDTAIILTDAEDPREEAVKALCGAVCAEKVIFVRQRNKTVKTSIDPRDGKILLKDITGKIAPLGALERGKLIESGVHYCELLPAEYKPSEEYLKQYENGLSRCAKEVAKAAENVAEQIYEKKGKNVVTVSLARAGTPVGMLITRYLRKKYNAEFAHYSVSIIRGKGIDKNAMRYILARHEAKNIQFVDGWTGKGAINKELKEALSEYPEISAELAVIADPAGVCEICGTREDVFIPCSCLNSTVSGLFSRTVLKSEIIEENDFHGAAYFGELSGEDRTYEFINAVEKEMSYEEKGKAPILSEKNAGLREAEKIAAEFGLSDINLVKPSIGETTRVLLRRVPRVILVAKKKSEETAHIEELAREKGVEVREYPLENYRAVGIIG